MSNRVLGPVVAAGIAASLLVSAPVLAAKKHEASAPTSNSNDPVVAIVNGESIHKSEVELALQQIVPPGKNISLADPQIFDKVRNDLISRKLAYEDAVKQGIPNQPDVKRAEAMAHQQIVTNAYFAKIAGPAVTEEKMKAAYDEAVKTQPKQDEVHAEHILVKTEDEANAIIKQLDGGADFEKLAKEKSIDKGNASDGGDLGYFVKGNMDPTFSDAAFALQPGTYTKTPVKTSFGYHIIKVLDKRPAKIPTFEEAKPQLRAQLQQRAIQDRIVALAKSSKIQAFTIDGSPEMAPPSAAPQPPAPPVPGAAPAGAPPAPAAGTPPLKLPGAVPAQ
jgi:peptidyl-prolyl cis-trans isomerase C